MPSNDLKPSEEKSVQIPESVTVKRFAELLELPVAKVIMELMKNKIMASINDEIDFESACIIAEDLGFTAEKDLSVEEGESITIEKLVEICQKEKDSGKNLKPRPAIVTILGHVDHGKTTLLDTIRKSNVAEGEAGGITQHITAYQAKKRSQHITFIDTPGHEAFASMRQRGVSLADIAILVVAADDGVRPQTEEVIKYLKEKNIPTIVAITKIDKPETNIQRVKQELAEREIMIEEWGGKYICNEVSAKSKKGLDDLLESILLVAEVEDFRADSKRDGLGTVLEAHLDKNKGPVATVLVKTGTLKVGQDILAGKTSGRIRRIEDWVGNNLNDAPPSSPVTVYGLSEVPAANDVIQVITSTRSKRRSAILGAGQSARSTVGKQRLYKAMEDDSIKKLNLVLKADTQGTLEAIEQMLDTFKSDEVVINYLGSGVGNITESDIKMSETAKEALLAGFNVEATSVAQRLAQDTNVTIKTYSVIYELINEIKAKMEDMLEPEVIRTDLGSLKVLAIFKTGKTDMIIGGKVTKGKIEKNALIEVQRGENIIGRGSLENLQKNKVDTNDVKKDEECGITFSGETKIKEDDTLLFFHEERRKKHIETA